MSALIEPGRIVGGRYLLIEAIGQGGMGTVWRARDELLSREVAIKEASPPVGVSAAERSAFRERTLREAQTAARLNHPNVVTVYDVVEEDDGWPWIVMELVEARSLRELVLADGPLAPEQAAGVALQLMAALRAAHELGIMHRDVKPGNVMIDADGHAVLADFGVARADDSPTLTSSNMILGSPAYMPPERARGGRGGPESDLWSLGATMYAAVEGRPPFDRNGALATLMAVAADDPDPPSRSGELWPVISGLLKRDPAQRLDLDTAERMLREIAGPDELGHTVPVASGDPSHAAADARSVDAVGDDHCERPAERLRQAEQTRAFRPAPLPPGVVLAEAGLADAALADEPGDVAPHGDVGARAPSPEAGRGGGEPGAQPPEPVLARGLAARHPRWLLAATAAAVAAAALLILIVWLPGMDQGRRGAASSGAVGHSASPQPPRSAGPSQSAGSPSPSAAASNPPAVGAQAVVPAGFRRYHDATGFSIAVPDTWTVSHQQALIYITPPSGREFLMIQQTDHPQQNPLADWRQQEANRMATYPGYHRIRLAAIRYAQAEKAADWEFSYNRNGVPTRVLNRNVLANPWHAYALYWSVPSAEWSHDWHFFQTFAGTFQPAGS